MLKIEKRGTENSVDCFLSLFFTFSNQAQDIMCKIRDLIFFKSVHIQIFYLMVLFSFGKMEMEEEMNELYFIFIGRLIINNFRIFRQLLKPPKNMYKQ